MRAVLLLPIAFALMTAAAAAETLRLPPSDPAQSGKTLPLKGTSGNAKANNCAAYGPKFYWVEAAGTCVKIGGSISVDAAVRR
jgi:hypothetical protein